MSEDALDVTEGLTAKERSKIDNLLAARSYAVGDKLLCEEDACPGLLLLRFGKESVLPLLAALL